MSVTFSNYLDTISWTSTQAQAIGDIILMDSGVGVSQGTPTASGQQFPVRRRGPCFGLVKDTLVAIAQGQLAYYDQVNAQFTTRPTSYRAGYFMQAQLIADTTCQVQLEPWGVAGVMASIIAPVTIGGAAFSAEAVVATLNMPANLPLFTRIRFKAKFRSTGQNSTDTLLLRIRFGGLAGTIVAAMTATQMAAATQATLDYEGIISIVGGAGALEGAGAASAVAAVINSAFASHPTAQVLTSPVAVVVTAIYSTNNATNAGILTDFALLRDS